MSTSQFEALSLADEVDEVDEVAKTYPGMAEVSSALRRLHAENASLKAGYDAARLEIDHLRGATKTVEPAHPVAWLVYLPSIDTQHVYDSQDDPGYMDDLTNHADAEVIPLYPGTAPKAEVAPAGEYPAGAIVNGRTHIDRLESHYRFDCEAGPLSNCGDWHGLKRCFEHLADCASRGQAAEPACDTPSYCRSVQRCTAQDELRAAPVDAPELTQAARDVLAERQPAAQALEDTDVLSMSRALFLQREADAKDAARWRYAVAIGGNQIMNWLDVYDDWDGDGDFADAIDAARAQDGEGGA